MLRIALCQVNVTVGDLEANAGRIRRAADEAAQAGADLALFPELTLAGYPPEDLLLRPSFVEACAETLDELAGELALPSLVGLPLRDEQGNLRNAAVFLREEDCATNRATCATPRSSCARDGRKRPTSRPCFPITRSSTSSATSRPARAD